MAEGRREEGIDGERLEGEALSRLERRSRGVDEDEDSRRWVEEWSGCRRAGAGRVSHHRSRARLDAHSGAAGCDMLDVVERSVG